MVCCMSPPNADVRHEWRHTSKWGGQRQLQLLHLSLPSQSLEEPASRDLLTFLRILFIFLGSRPLRLNQGLKTRTDKTFTVH